MHLSDIKNRLRAIDLLEILHDLEDRRFGAPVTGWSASPHGGPRKTTTR
jgi:hypothetical protein